MLIALGIIIGIVVTVIAICVLSAIYGHACPKGGDHEWASLGRYHGKYTMRWRGGDNLKVDGYVELEECPKCRTRKASRWVDYHDDEYGGLQEVDVAYAENVLKSAGLLKE